MNNRDRSILEHIIEYCARLIEYTKDMDFETFLESNIHKDACALCILQIGELVMNLTDEFKETEESDVDLIIASPITGLRYFGLIEELRTSLHKRVDLLNTRQLQGNYFLTLDVLNDGIKIYG